MSAGFTSRDFAPHLHTRFRVIQMQDCELELTEVTDRSNAQLEQFALIFTGAAATWLPQGAYTLLHPHMQECQLFLVPIGPDAAGMRYEAAFSRFV
jgi:hypothetical protein